MDGWVVLCGLVGVRAEQAHTRQPHKNKCVGSGGVGGLVADWVSVVSWCFQCSIG